MITLQICFYDCWYMTELIIPVFLPCHDGPGWLGVKNQVTSLPLRRQQQLDPPTQHQPLLPQNSPWCAQQERLALPCDLRPGWGDWPGRETAGCGEAAAAAPGSLQQHRCAPHLPQEWSPVRPQAAQWLLGAVGVVGVFRLECGVLAISVMLTSAPLHPPPPSHHFDTLLTFTSDNQPTPANLPPSAQKHTKTTPHTHICTHIHRKQRTKFRNGQYSFLI